MSLASRDSSWTFIARQKLEVLWTGAANSVSRTGTDKSLFQDYDISQYIITTINKTYC